MNTLLVCLLHLAGALSTATLLHAQGTAFTYQGRLNVNGAPASGTYDFRYRLALDPYGNNYFGSSVLASGQVVSNGLFTATLDFGAGAFNGGNYWLEIDVRTNGAGGYTALNPLQPVTPAPYAIFSGTASNALNATAAATAATATTAATASAVGTNGVNEVAIQNSAVTSPKIAGGQVVKSLTAGASALYDDVTLAAGTNVTITPSGNTLTIAAAGGSVADGSITTSKLADSAVTSTKVGDGSITDTKLANGAVTSSKIGDGAITSAKLADNAVTAARIVDNAVTSAKIMDGTVVARDIGSAQVVKSLNSLNDDVTLVQGANVTITPSGNTLTIAASAGGWSLAGNAGTTPGADFVGTTDNQPLEVRVNGQRALRLEPGNTTYGAPNVIGGTPANFVPGGVYGATIGGGGTSYFQWTNSVTGNYGTVGGGSMNTAGTSATVGGGYNNTAGASATVGGGANNSASGSDSATVAGGQYNSASSYSATVGGGSGNTASSTKTTVGGGAGNTASGGYATVGGGFLNQATKQSATVAGGQNNIAGGAGSFAAGIQAQANNDGSFVWSDGSTVTTSTADHQFMVRASGGVVIYSSSGTAAGVSLAAGSSTWGNLSDRNAKENFAPVTPQQVLAKVAELPITKWSYKTEQGVRHIGPMAQDFYAAFGVGEDDRHITTVDEGGVALAAIQGLNMKLREKDEEIQALKGRLEKLERALSSSTGNR